MPNVRQVTYTYEGPDMRGHVEALNEKRTKYRAMGGAERIERQHSQNKLTVRERLDLLFDEGTFVEVGLLAHHQSQSPAMQGKNTPADGVVTGIGEVDGRKVAVIAYDFTVMAGSMGHGHRDQGDSYARARAARTHPARLADRLCRRPHPGGDRLDVRLAPVDLFREQVIMSGVIPQVAAMMGPGAAGTAYIPGLADFVPMVKGNSNMALAGPHLVKAAVGEDVTAEDMGGTKVHCKISGVADRRGRGRRGLHRVHQVVSRLLPVIESRAAADRQRRPIRSIVGSRSSTTSCRRILDRHTTSTK